MCVRRLFVPGALLFLAGCGVTMTTDPLVTHGERIAVFDQPGWRLTLGPDKEAIPLDLSFVPSNRSYRINSKAKAWCFTANAVPFDSGYLVSVTVNEDRAGKIHEVLTDEECGFLSPLFLNIELMLDRTDYCVSALVVDSGREPCRISSLSSKELCALLKRGGASFKRIGILSRAEPNTNERRPAAGSPGPAALVPKVAGQIAETNLTRVTDSNYWCPRFVIPPDSAGAETNGSFVLEHAAAWPYA